MDKENILAKKLVELLRKKKLSITCAESCTGGGVAYAITSVAGSSDVFNYGFVTYSNEAKKNILKVPSDLLENYGAVSAETVTAMCDGACIAANAKIGIAVSGIAGPDGGTAEKPVGTVFIAWQYDKKIVAKKFNFTGSREEIRKQSIFAALENIIELIS